jgi:hypothetical protein
MHGRAGAGTVIPCHPLLQVLDFEQGRMNGSLTAEWGQLTRLKRLELTGNWIAGRGFRQRLQCQE